MHFDDLLNAVQQLLKAEGRASYRGLKRRFSLTDDDLEDIRAELVDARQLARDENDRVLVWSGASDTKAEAIPASRRQLSVMFCDVVGSTQLSTQLDPEDLRDLLRTYQGLCGQLIHEHGGHVAQYLGDGLLVYFGYPKAMEGAANSALAAGLAILRAVAQSPALLLNPSERLQVRIGIHTGPVVIGAMGDAHHQESLAVGETPNIAARIQGCAEPNQLVVSDDTRRVAGQGFTYDSLGAAPLKGIQTPVQLWRVLAEGSSSKDSAVSASAKLIGREAELAQLDQLWSQTVRGSTTFALLAGEPGIGKSRLVDEIVERIVPSGATTVVLQCDPRFSQSPFHPFLNLLAAADGGDTRWPSAVTDNDAPYLDALLGRDVIDAAFNAASPSMRRDRTMLALKRWLDGLAIATPAACIWEDLHAADPSTLELFKFLSATSSASPLMHLATSRPNDVVDALAVPTVTRLNIGSLSASDAAALAALLAGDKMLAPEVRAYIITTADGVPLFIEELTKMLLESDWLRNDDQQYRFATTHRDVAIPITLQDALMARLDHLPAGGAVAQYAAAIGREFDDRLLIELVAPRLHDAGIEELLNAGLICRAEPGTTRYQFKHALIGDTAYHSLLKSERRVYHAKIAEAIGRVMPETAQTQPELLAHHWTEADDAKRAVPLWQRAGELAMRRAANREALHHLEAGLEALNTLPHTVARDHHELALRHVMGPALITVKGNAAADVELCYDRVRNLCDALNDNTHAFGATFGLRSYYLARADLARSHGLGEQLLEMATTHDDRDELVEAHVALSNTHFFYGNFNAVQRHVDMGIALYNETMHAEHVETYGLDPGVICLSRAAQALWHRGFADRAVGLMDDALALGERLKHPFTSAYLFDNAAVLYQWRREGAPARRWADAAVTLSTKYAFPFFRAWGLMQLGAALVELGYFDDGIAQMDDGMALAEQIGVLLMQPWFCATRAEACLRANRAIAGLGNVEDGLAVVEHTGAVYAAPALYWLKGELLMLQSIERDAQTIENSLMRSMQIADEHGSLGFALRAATALARLWQLHGKGTKARRMLSARCEMFDDGSDTVDMRAANALLYDLA